MANAATVSAPDAAPQVGPIVPFVRASVEHVEPANVDETKTIGVSSQLLGPFDVPAYGYLRHLLILVETAAGTGTAAVYEEDAPWSAIQEVALSDVNGAPILQISGFDLYLVNKYGGYAGFNDPTKSAAYVAPATSGAFSFLLRVPVEISSRDGLGALPNMNASATYKLRLVLAGEGDIWSTNPTTRGDTRIRVWAECWAPPATMNGSGAPQAVQPPAVGTTQFWSKFVPAIAAGHQTVQFRRVGNLIRTVVAVFRDSSGARSTADLPDPLRIEWDGRVILNEGRTIRRHYMSERYGHATLDTGVLVWDFTHDLDGVAGGEMRDQWLPTVQSSRLELVGTFGDSGALSILTNDVAPVGNPYIG